MEDVQRSRYFHNKFLNIFVCTIKNRKAIILNKVDDIINQMLNSYIFLKMQLSAVVHATILKLNVLYSVHEDHFLPSSIMK